MSTINKKCVAVKFVCYFAALLQEAGSFKTGRNPFCAFVVVFKGAQFLSLNNHFFFVDKGFSGNNPTMNPWSKLQSILILNLVT